MGLVIADLAQRLITVRDDRRAFVGTDRGHGVHHIRNVLRIVNNDFPGFFGSQIGKLLQHFIGGMQVERRGILIGHAHALLNDGAVDLVFRIQKMHISRCHDRLAGLFSQTHDGPVEIQ